MAFEPVWCNYSGLLAVRHRRSFREKSLVRFLARNNATYIYGRIFPY